MGHIDFAESISITQKCHICTTDLEQNYTVFGYLNLRNLAVHSQYSKLFVCGKLLCIVFKMVWLDINWWWNKSVFAMWMLKKVTVHIYISAIYNCRFLFRAASSYILFLTILTRLLILCSLVFILPYTFSCLKTWSTNMNKPCMKSAKTICHTAFVD